MSVKVHVVITFVFGLQQQLPPYNSKTSDLHGLPVLAIDAVFQVQLTEFIPQLVCMVTGRQNPQFGKKQFKPEWWPDSVAWRNPDTSDTTRLPVYDLELRQENKSPYAS